MSGTVEQFGAVFPAIALRLSEINRALRQINFGKMEWLPYDEVIEGYHLSMKAELTPQGKGRPPAVGHWHLEITRDDRTYFLLLQGKARGTVELAELVCPCGLSEEVAQLAPTV